MEVDKIVENNSGKQTSRKKIKIKTTIKKMLADVYDTCRKIDLRLRDQFYRYYYYWKSADHHAAEKYSFICINAIAGIEIIENEMLEYKLNRSNKSSETEKIRDTDGFKSLLWKFMRRFEVESDDPKTALFAQGFMDISPLMQYSILNLYDSKKQKKISTRFLDCSVNRLYHM